MNFDLQKNHPSPLFQQFAEVLRTKIRSGELPAGARLPALEELAAMAGISIFTADRGIKGLIAEGLLLRRPKKGTYVCENPAAATPAPTDQRRIILCVLSHHPAEYAMETYFGSIFVGIQEASLAEGVHLIISPMEELEANVAFYQAQAGFSLQGVILLDEVRTERYLPVVAKFPGIRFVLTNSRIPDFEMTPQNLIGIFHDDLGGGYDIAQFALRSGARRVVILSRKLPDDNYAFRVEGMIQALDEHGVSCEQIFNEPSREPNALLGRRYMRALLDSGKPLPELIMTVNDVLAAGALSELRESRPDATTRFTGYDGFPPSLEPLFPTVRIDFRKIGQRSAEVIVNRGQRRLPKSVNIAAQIIARGAQDGQSTSFPPGEADSL